MAAVSPGSTLFEGACGRPWFANPFVGPSLVLMFIFTRLEANSGVGRSRGLGRVEGGAVPRSKDNVFVERDGVSGGTNPICYVE